MEDDNFVELITKLSSLQSIGYWIDNENNKFYAPADIKDYKMIETEKFKNMKYIDNDSLTLIDIGLIKNINVIDLKKTDMDDTIKSIQSTYF